MNAYGTEYDLPTIKQAIQLLIDEIIGKDEPREVGYELQKTINIRNKLRQEQRAKAKELGL